MVNATRAALLAGLTLVAAGGAGADSLSTSNRAALFASQLDVLDGRAAQQYGGSVRLQPERAVLPEVEGAAVPTYGGRTNSPWIATAREAARRYGVPEDLFLRLVQQESGWYEAAVSPKGAMGLAQLMPGTAALLAVDPADPAQNLDGGARYLRAQFDTFGAWDLALAAYNAGPEAVRQYNGIPPYAETQNYVRVIWGS